MRALAVIPARLASVRFPGKPLAKLGGRSIIAWVYEATAESAQFEQVVVATESERIADCVRSFGGEAELTSPDHRTGTDRVAEVARRHPEADVVANVQGDQPFVSAAQLEALIRPYRLGSSPDMTTLACPLRGDPLDPNVVKVVCDLEGRALYFSRAPIPHTGNGDADYLHHLGLYAFTAGFLQRYAGLPETELEVRERLEQLRALAHGHTIVVCRTDEAVLEVNTPEDLARAEAVLAAR